MLIVVPPKGVDFLLRDLQRGDEPHGGIAPDQRGYLQADAEASLCSQYHKWIDASDQPISLQATRRS
jgi:hypothetical protein